MAGKCSPCCYALTHPFRVSSLYIRAHLINISLVSIFTLVVMQEVDAMKLPSEWSRSLKAINAVVV